MAAFRERMTRQEISFAIGDGTQPCTGRRCINLWQLFFVRLRYLPLFVLSQNYRQLVESKSGLALLLLLMPMAGIAWAQKQASTQSGWYVEAGGGAALPSTMKQAGRNSDDICYPTNICPQVPAGYRWYYDLRADRGTAFSMSVGRSWQRMRVEIAGMQLRTDIDPVFTGLTFLDGSSVPSNPNSDYTTSAITSIGDLTVRALRLNAYFYLPLGLVRLNPYLGGGLGASFLKVSDLFYHGQYGCAVASCDVDPSYYDSQQATDLTDTVLSQHLYAGTDYALSDRLRLGLQVAYHLTDKLSYEDSYVFHPKNDITSITEVSGIRHFAVLLSVRYMLFQ